MRKSDTKKKINNVIKIINILRCELSNSDFTRFKIINKSYFNNNKGNITLNYIHTKTPDIYIVKG